MIEELRPFVARRRERVKPKLAGFLSWLRSQRITGGRGITVFQTEEGTVVSASARSQSFVGAFKVTTKVGRAIRVGVGFVNGRLPTIDGKPLDQGPALQLPKTPPDDKPLFVFLQVKVDEKSGRINPEDKEAVTIGVGTKEDASKKDTGYHPIAVFYPLEGGSKLFQLAFFSYNHAYRRGRHFFVPA
jgi:hypothetical protein